MTRVLRCAIGLVLAACGPDYVYTPQPTTPTPAETASPTDEAQAPVLFGTPPPFSPQHAQHTTPETARRKLKLIVLGEFRSELIPTLADRLSRVWDLDVETLPPIALPKSAYYAPRKRYRAEKLAEHLDTLLGDNTEHSSTTQPAQRTLILGLTDKDLSTTKGNVRDWGVIGIAFRGGTAGVLSLHRMLKSARDDEHLRQRVEMVAAHEVGHMIGLEHCAEPGCFMRDAEGTLDNVDEATGQLGPLCQSALASLLDTAAPPSTDASSSSTDASSSAP